MISNPRGGMFLAGMCGGALLTVFVACLGSPARAQSTTTLVSADPLGSPSTQDSNLPSISRDGRYVTFTSWAPNLVPNDTNNFSDVFVRDRASGHTRRASVDSTGIQGNSVSRNPAISGDGRFVAFSSFATNLVVNDTNDAYDVFVHDLATGHTERVNVTSSGISGNSSALNVALSFDGRYVAFDSDASNLVGGDTNLFEDVFVLDRVTGQIVRVSIDSNGAEGNADSSQPSISDDGRYVSFRSSANNLVPIDLNQRDDVFVHDMQTGQTVRVSVNSGGGEAANDSQNARISGDGRWVVFDSIASNLVFGDGNSSADVFVHDRQTGQTDLVSIDSAGAQGDGTSGSPSISPDGRFVSFASASTNLVTPAPSAIFSVYVHDRSTSTTKLVSVDSTGVSGNGASAVSSISGDGLVVAFESRSTNFVASDTSPVEDIYAYDETGGQHMPFCFGDGSGTGCPCGNSSAPGSDAGCLSTLGVGGRLFATGLSSVAADSVTLIGTNMTNTFVLYFQGTTETSAGAGSVFGDGLRCAGGQVTRLAPKLNSNGESAYPVAGDASVSVRGNCHVGDFRTYQIWFRNAAAFCTPSPFNLTNGIAIQWHP